MNPELPSDNDLAPARRGALDVPPPSRQDDEQPDIIEEPP